MPGIARGRSIGFAHQRHPARVDHAKRAVLRKTAVIVAEAVIDEGGGFPHRQCGGRVGLRTDSGKVLPFAHRLCLGADYRGRKDRAALVRLLDDRAGDIDDRQADQGQRLCGHRSGDQGTKSGKEDCCNSEHGNLLPHARFPAAQEVWITRC